MPFSFNAEQRQTTARILRGVLLLVLMALPGPVLTSFIAAAILAYTLNPDIDWLASRPLGLHPLVVIFALLAFGQLFGFAGVLLALPVSAVLSVALRHVRFIYLKSSFYNHL
jgi:predicted PurR-regulated permease PerM